MQARLSKWHNRKKRPVHHRQANPLQLLIHLAQNNFTEFIFDTERLRADLLQHLVHGGIRCIQHKGRLEMFFPPPVQGVNFITVCRLFYPCDLPAAE